MSHPKHIYVRTVWGHGERDAPVVMLYEVTAADRCVERMVEIFADGRMIKEALGDDPRARSGSPCLCDGAFEFPAPEGTEALFDFEVSKDEFESAYRRADKKKFD